MSFWGSITGSDGIDQARSDEKKAYNKAISFTREGMAGNQALLGPGSNYQPAQSSLERLLGLQGAQAQEDAYGQYRESPGVDWARQQGEQALQRTAAAGGHLASGRTLADANTYGQGVAQQGFGDFYNRLAQLYGQKLGTATNMAGLNTNGYNRLGDLAVAKGQANAGYSYAQGQVLPNIISGGIKIGADLLGRAINPMSGASSYSSSPSQ